MFKNIARSLLGIVVCTTAAVALSACGAGADQAEDGNEQAPAQTPDGNELGRAAQPLSESFRASCFFFTVDNTVDGGDIHVRCQCRTKFNTLVPAGFDGPCFTDLANCNGVLKCGGC